jgi:Ca-activated chloride channel family protein
VSSFATLNKELQLGAAIAMFGMKLRQSKYLPKTADWDKIESIAISAHNPGNYLQKEFLTLIDSAKKLYVKGKGKKKKGEDED